MLCLFLEGMKWKIQNLLQYLKYNTVQCTHVSYTFIVQLDSTVQVFKYCFIQKTNILKKYFFLNKIIIVNFPVQ